jgi:hypothetical protein
MQETIVLAWLMLNIVTGEKAGPEISQQYFDSHVDCVEFMDIIAPRRQQLGNNEFAFKTPDSTIFLGGCYNAVEYEKRFNSFE